MLCTRSTAQSKPGAVTDSLNIVADYVANARPLLDSLTALRFRRLEVSKLTRDLKNANDHIDRLAVRLAQCREGATPLAFDAFEAKDRAGLETNRRRRWQAVTILTGAGVLFYTSYRSYKTLSLRWIWTF